MFGPMQQVGMPPFLAPPGLGQLMAQLSGGQPSMPMPSSLQLPGMNQQPQMPGWPPAPAHPMLKMLEGGDPSLPPMMWLPEEPMGANPEMQAFGAQPAGPAGAMPGAAAPQESVWSRMAGNIMNDKALQLGLMAIGLNMAQPIQPNQTSIGHLASAIGQGVNTIGTLRAREQDQKLKERQVSQGDRRIDVAERGQEGQLQQGQQRIGLDEQRLGLEGRRVETSESLAGSQIASQTQEREQKAEAFPRTLAKLEADIARAQQAGQVDEAQASLLTQKARLYPQEVRAGLIQANAAATNARANQQRAGTDAAQAAQAPAQVRIMDHVAEAMVRSGKAKSKDEAVSLLGEKGTTGSTTSGQVQAAQSFEETWRKANLRRADESEEAYNQRAAQERLKYMTTQRGKEPDYIESLSSFLKTAMPGEEAAAKAEFDKLWAAQGRQVPGAQGGSGKKVPMARVRETAKNRGMTEDQVKKLILERDPSVTFVD